MRTFSDTVLAFDRACQEAGVSYAFVGGVAVMAWGIPRATADVDALLDLSADKIRPFTEALHRVGLGVDARDFEDALTDRSHVSVFDDASGFHVDVKLATDKTEREELAAAVVVDLSGGMIRVPRREDVVAFKLLYGTPQDIQDARGILERQGARIDMDALRRTAIRLGVETRLEELL